MNDIPTQNHWEISLGINKYLQYMKTGEKTVEGRLNKGIFAKVKAGDTIKFFNPKNIGDFVVCEITRAQKYKTFEEMLQDVGFDKAIPDAPDISTSASMYKSIPGYREGVEVYGCVAVCIKVKNDKTTK